MKNSMKTFCKKILIASDGVSDTAELFMRGYQMYKMFADDVPAAPRKERTVKKETVAVASGSYSEFKIGQLARVVLRPMLESGMVSELEIQWLQTRIIVKEHLTCSIHCLSGLMRQRRSCVIMRNRFMSTEYDTVCAVNGSRWRLIMIDSIWRNG